MPALFVEKTIPSPLTYPDIFVKNQLITNTFFISVEMIMWFLSFIFMYFFIESLNKHLVSICVLEIHR